MIAVTIITKNQISLARTMFASLRLHNPGIETLALVIDSVEGYLDPLREEFQIWGVSKIGLSESDLISFLEKYQVTDAAEFLKPYVLRKVIQAPRTDFVFYCECDLFFTAPLDLIREGLHTAHTVCVPRRIQTADCTSAPTAEADFFRNGLVDSSFIGLRKSDDALEFLTWWAERSFVSSPWLDQAALLFNDMKILKNPGMNVAHWNLSGRDLEKRAERFLANGQKLISFRFEGFNPHQPYRLSRNHSIANSENGALADLAYVYLSELLKNGWNETQAWPASHWVTMASNTHRDDKPTQSGPHRSSFEDLLSPFPEASD